MFYVEDTTNLEEIAKQGDRLLILDGTTCLDDYTEDTVKTEESRSRTFLEYLTQVFQGRR